MRSRSAIQEDGKRTDLLVLEVLLDIRDAVTKQAKGNKPVRRKRTKKTE